jgi:formylglycine-generating enzyme required for sulfatase activity
MRFRFVVSVLTLVGLAWATLPTRAQQPPLVTNEKRVALVIGEGKYKTAPALTNPPNDARRMAEALRKLNFEVIEAIDVDNREFAHQLRDFGIKASQSDVGLVFYGGHGVQVDGQNYLIPIDAKLEREHDLRYEAMPLDLVLDEVSSAKKIGIVLLDACRNNPFTDRLSRSLIATRGGRGTTIGLAKVDNVPRNTIVVLATRSGEIAEDGSGDDSPFTQAILAHFRVPGLELSLFFRSVRDTVLRATNNRQEPFVFSSLGAEPFYFYPQPPNEAPQVGIVKPLEVKDSDGPTPIGVPKPFDPDNDPLTVHIVGLPRAGEIRMGGKLVKMNDTVTLETFTTATYKPDGKLLGEVGTFDYVVDDGRGATVMGVLPISVKPSVKPPIVEAEHSIKVYTGYLHIGMPTDPNGYPMIVTITGLPRQGFVRNGLNQIRVGDRVAIEQLGNLTYWPEPGTTGDMGALSYSVDNGHGGKADGKVDVQIASIDDRLATETDLWSKVQSSSKVEDFDAFLRLFPDSQFADAAKRRRQEVAVAAAKPPPTTAAQEVSPLQPLTPPQPEPRVATIQPIPLPQTPPPPVSPPRTASEPQTFKDCANCPTMVRVPGGNFMMGHAGDPTTSPPHRVSVNAFALSQFPITVGDWRACMADGDCKTMPRMSNPTDQTPVYNLSWDDAQAFAGWLSKKTGKKYRLPSEAEWEYAARAMTSTVYWWGDQVGVSLADCAGCGSAHNTMTPMPVGTFKPNAFGLYDMGGGVSQWTADCWFDNYQGAPTNGSARDKQGCQSRVLRGGSFRSDPASIAVTARNKYDASIRYITNGMRVALDLR